nr:hypothetical protein B296_00039435 [Ipomoea batatas]GMD43084.1 hypothetical protein B296_00039435 [Ipomoea batatas]GMD48048.1 hypothetical protein B296_00039435 [Ipomoea batatas]
MGNRLGDWSGCWRLFCPACRKVSQHIFSRVLFWEIPILPAMSYDIHFCIGYNRHVLLASGNNAHS